MRILLVVYDNDSYVHWFPQGLAYVAAVLRQQGYDVDVYSQDLHHWPDDHLTTYLDQNVYDVVGISVIAGYYQYAKLLALSAAINRSKNRPAYVIGGYGPTPDPAYFMEKTGADVVVMGEGEETTVELFEALENKQSLAGIAGIAWKDGNKVEINPRRGVIEDVDSIPWPAYDLFPIEYYRLMREPGCDNSDFLLPMMSGRGCTFKCTFCYRMDPGFRARHPDAIVEEMKYLQRDFGISYIVFSDDLLMCSTPRTIEVCEAIIKSGLKIKWNCSGRLNYARPDILKLMKEAGCVFINYGIESVDNEVLKNMKKGLNHDQIIAGVEATRDLGIHAGLNIIFGNLGDTPQTLQQSVDFLKTYNDGGQQRTIRPVTPYPGSPLFFEAIDRGLLKDSRDFYEDKHLNSDLLAVNFTDIADDDFHALLADANTQLAESHFSKQLSQTKDVIQKLYYEKDTSFRGFRQT
jgi:radical SAM superfamily enzyme YgiQ (UPF0313 family)